MYSCIICNGHRRQWSLCAGHFSTSNIRVWQKKMDWLFTFQIAVFYLSPAAARCDGDGLAAANFFYFSSSGGNWQVKILTLTAIKRIHSQSLQGLKVCVAHSSWLQSANTHVVGTRPSRSKRSGRLEEREVTLLSFQFIHLNVALCS